MRQSVPVCEHRPPQAGNEKQSRQHVLEKHVKHDSVPTYVLVNRMC